DLRPDPRCLRRPPAAPAHHRGHAGEPAVREVLPRSGDVRRRRRARGPVAGGARRVRALADHRLVRSGGDAAARRGRALDAPLRRAGHAQADLMRAGAEYRAALRDGRRVFVMGEGLIEDVTVHPATRSMVDEYVTWYDRHLDPAWQDVLLTPPEAGGVRVPWAFVVPTSAADLRGMGRSYSATIFQTAGNVTHTPAYGNLIALGILDAVRQRTVSSKQIADATDYRDLIARTGRFLTFSAGAATIGYRLREDPRERASLRVVRETDAGLVLSGKVGMHTSPVYAEDVYIGSHSGIDHAGHRATFVVAVNTPGVTVLCRKISARHANPFLAPLSSRFDELDGQLWLD